MHDPVGRLLSRNCLYIIYTSCRLLCWVIWYIQWFFKKINKLENGLKFVITILSTLCWFFWQFWKWYVGISWILCPTSEFHPPRQACSSPFGKHKCLKLGWMQRRLNFWVTHLIFISFVYHVIDLPTVWQNPCKHQHYLDVCKDAITLLFVY